MKAVDLFCGCGGLTLGLKQAGFQVIGAVDIDPLSIATYQSNHPEVTTWNKDIRKLTSKELSKTLNLRPGDLDLLAGCPPCQGFSSLRTLNGKRRVDDPRNDLIFEFLRFVETLRPKAVMMENVPGLEKDKRFKIFIKKMENMGYKGRYRILNAADFGVPQRRLRLIYLGGLGFEIPLAPPTKDRKTVKDAIRNLPTAGRSGDPLHDLPERRTVKVRELIKQIPKNGGSRSDLPAEYQLACHKTCNGFKDVYGRMAWDKPAPTITSGCFNPSKGRFLHPQEDRTITLREAALLQGFPKDYYFPASAGKSAIAAMIGNALPPPFVKKHAQNVLHQIKVSNNE